MKGVHLRKSPILFLTLANSLIFLAFLSTAGQARPGIDSPSTETMTVLASEELTSTATDTEPPVSETPSPLPISPTLTFSPSPSETFLATDTTTPTPAEQTLLLVGLSEDVNVESFGRSISYPVVDIGLQALGIYAVQVPAAQADEIMQTLSALPGVRYAEPNYTVLAQDTFPTDPAFSLQYALTNIHAPQAWDLTTGSTAITIAIIDSGVDLFHPELAPKILPGYDFVNGDYDPQDDNGHGTHVAGIAAAASNNGLGMAGVSWGARILPVKVLNAANSGTYSNLAAGIVWATDQGAQIINLSLGGSSASLTLENAVNYAAAHGVALVAAAGNTSGAILYPARYPSVIAVANTNAINERVSTSAFGPEIDLSAPGAGIYSLAIGGGYRYLSGTSMSAPHVSGALALLLSMPGVSAGQARAHLEASALDIDPPGWDIFTGSGLIQLDAALLLALPSPTPTSAPPDSVTWTPSSTPAGPFFGGESISPTLLPLPSATVSPTVSPTLLPSITSSPVFVSPTPKRPTAVILVTVSQTPTAIPAMFWRSAFSFRLPCLGLAMILLGLLLAFWLRRKRW